MSGSEFDGVAHRERYARETTERLVRIAFLEADDYVAEAVALAREELRRRGIDDHDHEEVQAEVEVRTREVEAGGVPLEFWLKIVCAVEAGFISIMIGVHYHQQGRRRAARDAWHFIAYGWATRVGLLVLMALVHSLLRAR